MKSLFVTWIALVVVVARPLPAHCDDPLDPLWIPGENQLDSSREAQYRNSSAANAARNAGHNSIGRGNNNMANGHHHFNPAQVSLGAFQILQGLLGLLAGQQADQLADSNGMNGSQLGDMAQGGSSGAITTGVGTSNSVQNDITTQGESGSNVGSTNGTSNAISNSIATAALPGGSAAKIGAVEMSDPAVKQALAQLQEQYGYQPGEVMQLLQKGASLKGILEHAPMNPLTPQEAQDAAMAAGKGDGSVLAAGSAPAQNAAGNNPQDASSDSNGVGAQGSNRNGLRDALTRALASDAEDVQVSPEVQAALANREAAEKAKAKVVKPLEEMDLFDVVHQKYRERENNLRWGEPLHREES